MNRFKLLFFVIFIVNLYNINGLISDKRLCVDEECRVPISLAKTLIRYASPEPGVLSFAPNDDVTIYSKSAGSRTDLWGVEIKGRRGYVPQRLVREVKLLQPPKVLVDTEKINETKGSTPPKQVPLQVEPDKVQEPYEVVDGTTIYDINPSVTDSSVQATELPKSGEVLAEEESGEPEEESGETEEDDNDDEEADVEDEENEEDQRFHNDISEDNQEHLKEEPLKNAVPLSAKLEEILEHVQENVDIASSTATGLHQSEVDKIPEAPQEPEIQNQVSDSIEQETVSDKISTDELSSVQQNTIDVTTLSPEMDIPQPTYLEEEVTENPTENLSSEEVSTPSPPIKEDFISKEEQVQPTVPPLSLFNHVSQEIDSSTEKTLLNEPVQVDEATILPNPASSSEEQPLASTEDPQKLVSNSNESYFDDLVSVDNISSETVVATNEQIQPVVSVSEDLPLAENLDDLGLIDKTLQLQGQVLNDLPAEESANLVKENQPSDVPLENNLSENEDVVEEKLQPETLEKNILENAGLPEENSKLVVQSSSDVPLAESVSADKIDLIKEVESIQESTVQVETSVEATNTVEEQVDQPNDEPGFFEGLLSHFSGNSQVGEEAAKENNEETSENISNEQEELNEKLIEEEVFEPNENKKDDFVQEELNKDGILKDEQPLVQEISTVQDGSQESSIEDPTNLALEASSEQIVKRPDYTISHSDGLEQCEAESCKFESTVSKMENEEKTLDFISNINADIFIYLATTAISVIIFLLGYLALDKSKREGPLVGKINKLEKEMLIILKENEMLQERAAPDLGYETNDKVSSEVVENLQQQLFEATSIKNSLEEQVHSLEKELENSTEVGLELNKMLTEILSSESGSDVIKAKVEYLQGQLVEQQSIINSINETLAITNTENHELKLELEITNKKVIDLQAELDKLLNNLLKIEEEKENQQTTLENQIVNYKKQYDEISKTLKLKETDYKHQIDQITDNLEQTTRKMELKIKEYAVLADTLKQLKNVKDTSSLLKVTEIKAEYQQLKTENERFKENLRLEKDMRCEWERKAVTSLGEVQQLKEKYGESERAKVEIETKLEVLSNYFKDREAQYQREISKHESLWVEKQGEATSTTERIKFMQEQLQNYKSQTESLKQEIVSQEVELKSQISVLEKKIHENWVTARQTERKLEESKQEAAQLRHRLTLSERALHDDKIQRLQSPMEQNGDLESPASPPLLFPGRDMMTKSPPISGLPPFLPPPPGVPFMPPPLHGVPPFIPPPPNMFPGDHRPPPLGRMSSPPLNSRYSPSSRGYSPYDRNSSSPSDSEYGASPPHRRTYSPYNSREYSKRGPPGRINGRDLTKGGSSGSGHSNESLEKINRQPPKV